MIDHIYLPVSDLKRSSEFYKKLLEPLGIDMDFEVGQPPIRGFTINNMPSAHLRPSRYSDEVFGLQTEGSSHWGFCAVAAS